METRLSEASDQGITVTEIAAMGQAIELAPDTTAAFVGRALRGPVNMPVLVESLAEYRRRFGELWSRSSLGPAVQQFFAHGGERLYVVRVANNARGAMICLPAGGSALVLRSAEPGSTEFIRAAVDYDGIDDGDDDFFNLVLQRINPVTRLIEDQELYSRLSFREGAENFVGDALAASALAHIEYPYPSHRPDVTLKSGRHFESGYVEHVQAGTDGNELSDYDLIGSRSASTGLFALQQVEQVDLLYLPPPGNGSDLGPAAVLAAEQFCRERGAMLVIDPRAEWATPAQAAQGVRGLGYISSHMIGYFPRVESRDGSSMQSHAAGGVITGLLCRHDRKQGAWQDLDPDGMPLSQALLPAVDVSDSDRQLLKRAGLNVIAKGAASRARLYGSVTMRCSSGTPREFSSLSVQRFCLRVINSVAAGARWSVFERKNDALARRVRAQVSAYFIGLANMGALADAQFVVKCDAGVSRREDSSVHGVTILLAFQPAQSAVPVSLTLHLTPAGCRVGSTAFAPAAEEFLPI
jgi:phage tail sheath protein FI